MPFSTIWFNELKARFKNRTLWNQGRWFRFSSHVKFILARSSLENFARRWVTMATSEIWRRRLREWWDRLLITLFWRFQLKSQVRRAFSRVQKDLSNEKRLETEPQTVEHWYILFANFKLINYSYSTSTLHFDWRLSIWASVQYSLTKTETQMLCLQIMALKM